MNRLLRWYYAHRRRLPWRGHPSPYRTWISEIMLQQTQVAAMLPYYRRFLRRFPGIRSLARAPEREVLRLWAGLGYYARARNLHRAAKRIVVERAGRFPDSWEGVTSLPGVGRYTAGAILSIAFGKPYPILDGNVARVLARFHGLREPVEDARTQHRLWEMAERALDKRRPGDWNQALMELGALVCLPMSPLCGRCPLSGSCAARRGGLQDSIPKTRKARRPVRLRWTCLWIERDGKVLLWKRSPAERLLPGHWGLPEGGQLRATPGPRLAVLRHSITHHRIALDIRGAAAPAKLPPEACWVPRSRLKDRLVSSLWLKAAANMNNNI